MTLEGSVQNGTVDLVDILGGIHLLYVDHHRAAYKTIGLTGDMNADIPRARAFYDGLLPADERLSDEAVRFSVLDAYTDAAGDKMETAPGRQGEIQNPPTGPGVPTGPTLCEMDIHARYETKDIVNLTVSESNIYHDSWASYDSVGGTHHGACSGKTVRVRIGPVPVFTTHWVASACRGLRPKPYGSSLRTHARGEYWNDDFPLIRIGRIVYPGSVVNVEHNVWIQSHPESGRFIIQRQGVSWGNNGITRTAAYLLSHHLTRGRAQHYCW